MWMAADEKSLIVAVKHLAAGLMLCLLWLPLASAQGEGVIGQIQQRGELLVALLDRDIPPFFMRDAQGELYGLDVQLARGIAERLGVNVRFNRQATTFDGVVQEVIDGRADMAISKLSRTLKRAERVLFSRPYLVLHQGLLFNRVQMTRLSQGQSVQTWLRNLRGRVGVLEKTSYETFLAEKFPQATAVPLPSWDEVVEGVVKGDLLAAYRDELEVKKIIRGRPKEVIKLKTVVLKDSKDPIAMVFPLDSAHLRDWVNIYLETLHLHYSADSLLDEYEEIFAEEEAP
jgi:polar amino acid transport system substrate-binding protein